MQHLSNPLNLNNESILVTSVFYKTVWSGVAHVLVSLEPRAASEKVKLRVLSIFFVSKEK